MDLDIAILFKITDFTKFKLNHDKPVVNDGERSTIALPQVTGSFLTCQCQRLGRGFIEDRVG